MFDPHGDWLPLGSVVRLHEAERPVMVAGYLAIDGSGGGAWDYVGYPYPEGKQVPEEHFFDRADVEELFQLGFCDAEGMAFLAYLQRVEEEMERDLARLEEPMRQDARR